MNEAAGIADQGVSREWEGGLGNPAATWRGQRDNRKERSAELPRSTLGTGRSVLRTWSSSQSCYGCGSMRATWLREPED